MNLHSNRSIKGEISSISMGHMSINVATAAHTSPETKSQQLQAKEETKSQSLSLWLPEAKHQSPKGEGPVKDFMVLTKLTSG